MKFNDTTNRNGLVQQYEVETGLTRGAVSDNSAPDYFLDSFLVRCNEWLHRVEQWAHEANPEAIFDDINNTGTIPEEYDFVDNEQTIDLDSDITKIRKVEARLAGSDAAFTGAVTDVITSVAHGLSNGQKVKLTTTGTLPTGLSINTRYYVIEADTDSFELSLDLGGTAVDITGIGSGTHTWETEEDWYDFKYWLEADRPDNIYGQNSAQPNKYFQQGRKLIFDVPIDTAKADKYRITFDRHGHEFVIGDTDAEPGFDKRFHQILYWGPTMDYAAGKYPDIFNKARLKIFGVNENDKDSLRNMLKKHYREQVRAKVKIGRPKKTML